MAEEDKRLKRIGRQKEWATKELTKEKKREIRDGLLLTTAGVAILPFMWPAGGLIAAAGITRTISGLKKKPREILE
jgi:hypothetical protein